VLSFIAPSITAPSRAFVATFSRASVAVAVAVCLLASCARVAAQTLVFAEAEADARAEEIPAPAPVIEGLQNDIRRLEKEIEALRAEKAAPAVDTVATKRAEKKSETLVDRLSAVEKSLGKLVDASDKKKNDEAKKPLFILSGQMQADQIYFSQDPESRAALGDLQDGAQFRRLRIGGQLSKLPCPSLFKLRKLRGFRQPGDLKFVLVATSRR
jgi:alanyl-tRNA synthetase